MTLTVSFGRSPSAVLFCLSSCFMSVCLFLVLGPSLGPDTYQTRALTQKKSPALVLAGFFFFLLF